MGLRVATVNTQGKFYRDINIYIHFMTIYKINILCIQDAGVCPYILNSNSNPMHNTPLLYKNLIAYIRNPSNKNKVGSMAIIMDQTLDSLVLTLPTIHLEYKAFSSN